jgi:hypothetical protein
MPLNEMRGVEGHDAAGDSHQRPVVIEITGLENNFDFRLAEAFCQVWPVRPIQPEETLRLLDRCGPLACEISKQLLAIRPIPVKTGKAVTVVDSAHVDESAQPVGELLAVFG